MIKIVEKFIIVLMNYVTTSIIAKQIKLINFLINKLNLHLI